MARINDIAPANCDEFATKLFETQTKKWGAPLLPYLIYARRPNILRAVRGMWDGLAASGLLDAKLVSLLNRRVAFHNGCLF
jgi:alkylhydroperoxidase family enzyme